jgi:tetratricopeptide (TPR) repeat protein
MHVSGERERGMGRYEEAIAQSRRGLELGSDDFPTLFVMGESYTQKGAIDEGVRACKESVAASDRHPVALGSLAHVYGLYGMHDEAFGIIEELKQASQNSYVLPASIANAYLGLGLIDESLSWLGKAWKDRSTTLPYLVCHPSADRFRSNSGFQDLRRRMNLGW